MLPTLEQSLEETRQEVLNRLEEDVASILEACGKDPEIAKFVRLILAKDEWKESFQSSVQSQLQAWCYELGCEIQRNSYHSPDVLYNLKMFIGNYFLDDSYFVICPAESLVDKWEVVNESQYPEANNATQDPKKLLKAAREQVRHRHAYFEAIKRRNAERKALATPEEEQNA